MEDGDRFVDAAEHGIIPSLEPLHRDSMAWMLMGEHMSPLALLGMMVTLCGISISILGKDEGGHRRVKLPLRGVRERYGKYW